MAIEYTHVTEYTVIYSNYKGNTKRSSKTWLTSYEAAQIEAEALREMGWREVKILEDEKVIYEPEPEPARTPDAKIDALINDLTTLPDAIYDAQRRRNAAELACEAQETRLCIGALTVALFPAKDGTLRAASNDDERKLAQRYILASAADNPTNGYAEACQAQQNADDELARLRNKFEAVQLVARLEMARMTRG